mgnify:CR=1 FL=1
MVSLFKWGRHDDVHLSKGTANEIPSKALLIFKILNVSLYDFSFAENYGCGRRQTYSPTPSITARQYRHRPSSRAVFLI